MHSVRWITVVLLLATASAQDRVAQVDHVFRGIDPDEPGCAVGVYRGGETLLERAYGRAQLEYDVPVTPKTIFHVASLSKQFTAFAVALLAVDGALSLDDDVREHVPELHDFGATITLRHLLHHTSGLRDQWDLLVLAGWRMDDVITRDDILELVQRQRELNFPPGERHLYCNTGYTLCALVVERVSGTPFPEFCAQRIFEPLGMRDTHFHDDHRRVVKGRAYSYWPVGDGTFRKAVLSYANAGATSLFTTVGDLGRWQANLATRAVGGAAVDMLVERGTLANGQRLDYALGLVHGRSGGREFVGHSGGDAGFRSHLVRFPEQDLSVAVLGNRPMPVDQLALQVAALWLEARDGESKEASRDGDGEAPGEGRRRGGGGSGRALSGEQDPDDDGAAREGTAARFAEYVGRYYSEELDVSYDVVLHEGRLAVKRRKYGLTTLRGGKDDRFRAEAQVVFTRDADGRIDGCLVSTGRVLNLRFRRL